MRSPRGSAPSVPAPRFFPKGSPRWHPSPPACVRFESEVLSSRVLFPESPTPDTRGSERSYARPPSQWPGTPPSDPPSLSQCRIPGDATASVHHSAARPRAGNHRHQYSESVQPRPGAGKHRHRTRRRLRRGLVQLHPAQASRVTLAAAPRSGQADPVVSLYNNDPYDFSDLYDPLGHRLVAQVQGSGGGPTSLTESLAAGTYFVAVSGAGNLYFNPLLAGSGYPGSTGAYTLQVSSASLGLSAASGPIVLATSPGAGQSSNSSPLVIRVDRVEARSQQRQRRSDRQPAVQSDGCVRRPHRHVRPGRERWRCR